MNRAHPTIKSKFISGLTLAILTCQPNMKCLMVKVCCKFDSNRTKATSVFKDKPRNVDGSRERLKTENPLNYVCGCIKIISGKFKEC